MMSHNPSHIHYSVTLLCCKYSLACSNRGAGKPFHLMNEWSMNKKMFIVKKLKIMANGTNTFFPILPQEFSHCLLPFRSSIHEPALPSIPPSLPSYYSAWHASFIASGFPSSFSSFPVNVIQHLDRYYTAIIGSYVRAHDQCCALFYLLLFFHWMNWKFFIRFMNKTYVTWLCLSTAGPPHNQWNMYLFNNVTKHALAKALLTLSSNRICRPHEPVPDQKLINIQKTNSPNGK